MEISHGQSVAQDPETNVRGSLNVLKMDALEDVCLLSYWDLVGYLTFRSKKMRVSGRVMESCIQFAHFKQKVRWLVLFQGGKA